MYSVINFEPSWFEDAARGWVADHLRLPVPGKKVKRDIMKYNSKSYPHETDALDDLIDDFISQMKMRLAEKTIEGFHGWDDPIWRTDQIKSRLKTSLEKSNMVDVANLAMFLWNRQE